MVQALQQQQQQQSTGTTDTPASSTSPAQGRHHHSHRRHSTSQSSSRCSHHRQHHHRTGTRGRGEAEDDEERERCRSEEETGGEEEEEEEEETGGEEEEVAGTTAPCTEDERQAASGSVSTMYAENCHCSRGNITTTDDDDEIQQYFVVDHQQQQQQHQQQQQQQHCYPVGQQTLSRRPSVSSCTSRVSHRSTPRSRRVTTPMSCCSHHSHHSQPAPVTASSAGAAHPARRSQDGGSPASRRTLPTDNSGSNATISNFNINPARFQCSYYTADESENSYCSISGENIRQIQAQTAIQHRLDREEQKQRLLPLPLAQSSGPGNGTGGGGGGGGSPGINHQLDNDSQQDVASLDEGSLLSTVGSTSSAEQGGPRGGGGGGGGGGSTTTTTSTTTSTTQRQLHQQQVGGAGETPKSAGSQLVLTPSKITIENIGQLSEIGTEHYEFDDLDINIPEIFQSPSKIKWSFLANLDESNKSNKSRISSVSSLVDAASSGRGRFSGTESGGADVSETASDNEYNSPNRRIRRRRPEPLPSEAMMMMGVAGTSGGGIGGGHQSTTSGSTVGHGIQTSSSSCKIEELLKKSSPSASSDFKTVSIWRAENGDEGNAIIFHHESEIVENCCTNHFLDHSSYDVCRVDNCDYLIKSSDTDTPAHGHGADGGDDDDDEDTGPQGRRRRRSSSCTSLCKSTERLNNAIVPPATIAGTMTKQLELKQRNIFTTTLAATTPSAATMTHAATGSPGLVIVPSSTMTMGPQTSTGTGTGTGTGIAGTAATVYSIISPDLKRFEKQTNLNRNSVNLSQNLPPSSPSSSSTSSIFAGNYGSSAYRNINHTHHHGHHHSEQQQQQQSEQRDKHSNTMSRASSSRSRLNTAPASTVSRSATSSLQRHSVGSRGLSLPSASGGGGATSLDGGFNNNNNQQPSGSINNNNNNNNQSYYSSTFDRSTAARTLSTASSLGLVAATDGSIREPGDPSAPPFSISVADETTAETVAAAAASQFYNKSYHYNLTAQNQLYFQAFSNLVREQEQQQQQQQQNCEFHQQQPQTPSPQPQPSCPQCYEYYGCQAQYYANATNEADNEFAECHGAGGESGTGGVMRRRGGWRRNVGTTLRINGLVRVVRTRARKCADYIRQKEHQSNNRFRRRK